MRRSERILGVLGAVLFMLPGTPQGPPARRAAADPGALGARIRLHLGAIERAALWEGRNNLLSVRLHLIPDAYTFEVLDRVQRMLDEGLPREQVVERIRKDSRSLARLRGRSGFHAELLHEARSAGPRMGGLASVQLFDARLERALRLRAAGHALPWKLWKEPQGLDAVEKVRVARHYKVQNGALRPFVSPLQPDHPRAVFRSAQAHVWGLFSGPIFGRGRGPLVLRAEYDQFRGSYDDRHVINLNPPEHRLERDQRLEVRASLPNSAPPLPADLVRLIEEVDAGE